ncbi:hypothetical protein RvY_02435 [Ramazzottius varieornatus]|uniref:DDE Tnp4 domain-containing protein n=1 Tax=Ramazzottius varieornatus TaxID=947166 RepID=A0A1D1UJN9_RAMVA|nr:hypothetical protein RvY_02435 [Ramazzottius varieornatus]
MMNKFRRFPEVQGTARVFRAVDGTHINYPALDNKREEYINRHRKYSLNVQGLVDPDCRFLHVSTGAPGRVHDSRVFVNSGLLDNLPDGYQILSYIHQGYYTQHEPRRAV